MHIGLIIPLNVHRGREIPSLQNISVHIINNDHDNNDYDDVAIFVIDLKIMMYMVNLEHTQEKYSFLLNNKFV